MCEYSNGVKEESCPWSLKAGILKFISPLRVVRKNNQEACKPKACYCTVVWKLHWGLLFALSPPWWAFTPPTAQAGDKISSETGHAQVSRCSVCFSSVFVIIWGSSSGFKFHLYVHFWPECIHLFSNHNKIIFCCTFFPLSPNYSRLFLLCRHCQSHTGPLLSTTGPGALQASYCATSSSQTSSLDQGLLSFNSSLQHFPHLYVGAAVPAAERSG